MARGGPREGAGRPIGARNKLDRDAAKAVATTGMTPLEYLTSIYQDVGAEEAKRIEAAKAAAPYVHPKLSSVEMNATVNAHEDALAHLR